MNQTSNSRQLLSISYCLDSQQLGKMWLWLQRISISRHSRSMSLLPCLPHVIYSTTTWTYSHYNTTGAGNRVENQEWSRGHQEHHCSHTRSQGLHHRPTATAPIRTSCNQSWVRDTTKPAIISYISLFCLRYSVLKIVLFFLMYICYYWML